MGIIRELLLEIGAKIRYFDPFEFPNLKDGMKFSIRSIIYIFVSIRNSEMGTQNVLLHEIGHGFFGHNHLSCRCPGWDRKQERQADRYMIEYRADEWLSAFDWEPEVIDYDAFLEYFELERRHRDLAIEVFDSILVSA